MIKEVLVGIAVVVWMILSLASCKVASRADDQEEILLAEYKEIDSEST